MLRAASLGALFLCASACWIDFREGLRCETDADCEGLTCAGGRCTGNVGRGLEGIELGPGVRIGWTMLETVGAKGGVLRPGGSAALRIRLQNFGTEPAAGLVGRLETPRAGVTFNQGSAIQFGAISPAEIACGTTGTAAPGACTAGAEFLPAITLTRAVTEEKVPVRLILTAGNGRSGVLEFQLAVNGGLETLVITRLEAVGGLARPGEATALRVGVLHLGEAIPGARGTLSTSFAGVTLEHASLLDFGDLEPGLVSCGTRTVSTGGDCLAEPAVLPRLHVDATVSAAARIPMQLVIADDQGHLISAEGTLHLD